MLSKFVRESWFILPEKLLFPSGFSFVILCVCVIDVCLCAWTKHELRERNSIFFFKVFFQLFPIHLKLFCFFLGSHANDLALEVGLANEPQESLTEIVRVLRRGHSHLIFLHSWWRH